MSTPDAEQVAVVIPAFNAERWIDATLTSVGAQTHAALDVVVVDDGSTDRTAAVVETHARRDGRVRLLKIQNGGVARARNAGIAASGASLIAIVDADDLWAPTKIEKQLARLREAGAGTGLVYTWFAVIDEAGAVRSSDYRPTEEGDVMRRLWLGNLLGNGSSALFRRQAWVDAGGFDQALRDHGAQGCEDFQFYARVAEAHRFALVPEFLTGYRLVTGAMSNDASRMLKSWDMVAAEILARHPEAAPTLRRGRTLYLEWLLDRAIRAGAWRQAARRLVQLARHDLYATLELAPARLLRHARRIVRLGRRTIAGRRSRTEQPILFLPPPSKPQA